MYGYLHGICVVDEPAVEIYKAHTRRLRERPDPRAALGAPFRTPDLVDALTADLSYVDITVNGEPGPADLDPFLGELADRLSTATKANS